MIDYDHRFHEIFLTQVADKQKLRMAQHKPSLKGIGFEATTIEKDSLKNNKKPKTEKNTMESSLRNLQ